MAELDRVQLQKDIHALYRREHAELGEQGTLDHLERGKKFELSDTLKNGGVLVFPHAGVHPEQLPGIEEVAAIAKDSVIVSTADAFHHGLGYGDTPENSFDPDEAGLRRAQSIIEDGIRILEKGDYWGYNQHCVQAKSDARDAGQVFRYIRGPMTGRVIDMSYTDASELYKQPPPTWVAGALTEWRLS